MDGRGGNVLLATHTAQRGYMMSDENIEYSLDGLRFEETPAAIPTLGVPELPALPDRVDLRPFCSPVENQLNTSSCVANAVVGAFEFHQKRAGLPVTDLSRLFVYYNSRKLSGSEGEDCGTYVHHAMAALLAHGACEERMWPLQKAMVSVEPTRACFENARRYSAVQFARVPQGLPMLVALSQGLPIVFGISIPRPYYDIAEQTGLMPGPKGRNRESPRTGHAMLVVGYDNDERTLLIRNSWGERWGDGGYFRMPYDIMDAYGRDDGYWTIGAIEQMTGFSLLGVNFGEAMAATGVSNEPTGLGEADKINQMRSSLRSEFEGKLSDRKQSLRDRLKDD